MKLSQYLGLLQRNNNRPWFVENKTLFDDVRQQWYDDLDHMISLVGLWEPRVASISARDASYRIYRDTRFSLDKTPYKTYFSAILSPRGKRLKAADYYIHAGAPGTESLTAGGYWAGDSSALQKLRHAIVDNIEEFRAIIDSPEFSALYPGWYGPRLKSAPKGWPRNHPEIELLRLQVIGREHRLPGDFFDDPSWPEKAADLLRPLKPLIDFINYSLLDE